MDAGTLRRHLEWQGLALKVVSGGLQVEPASALTTETRSLIRAHRDELMALVRQSPAHLITADNGGCDYKADAAEAEIRVLLAREMRGAGASHSDYAEALRIALADPGAALEALRSPVESWSADKRAELRRVAGELREGKQ